MLANSATQKRWAKRLTDHLNSGRKFIIATPSKQLQVGSIVPYVSNVSGERWNQRFVAVREATRAEYVHEMEGFVGYQPHRDGDRYFEVMAD